MHPLTAPHRPHNSLYVISDTGKLVTRYDERMLSNTKVSYLYTPGTAPVTFEVDGVRFGCLLGMEVHFPELFDEYEKLGVDCVLFSSTGAPAGQRGVRHRGAGARVGQQLLGQRGHVRPAPASSRPDGNWLATPESGLAVAELDESSAEIAVFMARPWRRTARGGLYEAYRVTDPRSDARDAF